MKYSKVSDLRRELRLADFGITQQRQLKCKRRALHAEAGCTAARNPGTVQRNDPALCEDKDLPTVWPE